MRSIYLLLVLSLSVLLTGCFTKKEYIYRSYPQYVVLDIEPAQSKPVEVPKLSISREEFIKLPPEKQRDFVSYLLVDVIGALKKANDRLIGVVSSQEEKKASINEINRKIEEEIKR